MNHHLACLHQGCPQCPSSNCQQSHHSVSVLVEEQRPLDQLPQYSAENPVYFHQLFSRKKLYIPSVSFRYSSARLVQGSSSRCLHRIARACGVATVLNSCLPQTTFGRNGSSVLLPTPLAMATSALACCSCISTWPKTLRAASNCFRVGAASSDCLALFPRTFM